LKKPEQGLKTKNSRRSLKFNGPGCYTLRLRLHSKLAGRKTQADRKNKEKLIDSYLKAG